MPTGRGGPQRIPRPPDARLGGAAPWAHIPESERVVALDRLEDALVRRRPRTLGAVPHEPRQSAVLAVLYEEDGEPHVVLTRRSPRLRSHAHEVAFPGGRHDDDDADLWSTAVREAIEEVDLDPTAVRPIGSLDSFMTVGSSTLVHPFVAVADRRPELTPSPDEVESIRHVPLRELLLDEVVREEVWPLRHFGEPRAITFFEIADDTIWGATGAMLRQLLAIATGSDDRIRGGPG